MKKRIILCAALFVCFAAMALAGGAQEKETPEYFRKPSGESASDPYIYGENMPEVYTYGGSKRDWVHDMAVSPDGRIAITGYTESSDGTLSDRTKTWRAGWVMMLDKDMNVMWNFCSRSGDTDHMYAPVFHRDGTVSVVHETEGKQIKIVWIDENGREALSKTVMTVKAEDEMISVVGAMEEGYLLCRAENYDEKRTYTLFDGLGGRLWTLAGPKDVQAVSGNHLLCETEEGLFLSTVDTDGLLTTLCSAAQMDTGGIKRQYKSLVSLADGGAVACGSIWEGTSPVQAKGILSRWDAQGNIVFEMYVMGNPLSRLTKTANGFAAQRIAQEEGKDDQWELVCFDENGILSKIKRLEGALSRDAGDVAALDDGTILCANLTGVFQNEDVLVTVEKTE